MYNNSNNNLLLLHYFSTPPSRTAKFEEFKQERGVEINKILVENKEILASKKKTYADLAKQINNSKAEIDMARDKLERLKEEREANGTNYSIILLTPFGIQRVDTNYYKYMHMLKS